LYYTVVGTGGVVNTNGDTGPNVSSEPQIGDRIDRLPANSKPVVIKGEKLYSTSSGLYYKEVFTGIKYTMSCLGSNSMTGFIRF